MFIIPLSIPLLVSLVEQEVLTLSEHLRSPRFLVGFVLPDLFYVVLCRSLFVLWFVLVIVLSGLPQFTASNYHIGICNFTIVPTGHNSGQESGVCTSLNLIYRGDRDRTVVGFTTTYANSTYHH